MKDGDSRVMVRTEAIIMDGNIDILAKMNIDLETRKEWDKEFSNIHRATVFSENEDLITQEMKMPFPVSDRDFLLHRYYVHNKLHPQEIIKKGLWKKNNSYWTIFLQSVENEHYPVRKSVVRAENTTVLLFEEDADDPRKTRYSMVARTDLKGQIPFWAIKQGVGKKAAKVVDATFDSYRKNVGKWLKEPLKLV